MDTQPQDIAVLKSQVEALKARVDHLEERERNYLWKFVILVGAGVSGIVSWLATSILGRH